MKRSIAAIIAFLLVLVVLAGVYFYRLTEAKRREMQLRQAILNVIHESESDLAEFQRHKNPRNLTIYARKIGQYDTSECPRSFQEAWVDYSMAWIELSNEVNGEVSLQNAKRKRAAANALGDIIELTLAAETGGTALLIDSAHMAAKGAKNYEGPTVDTGNQQVNKVLESGARCKKIAIHYGVAFHPKN